MIVRQPHYSKEEFARRGDEIYEQQIRPRLHAEDEGKIVTIDIDSGAWEIDGDEMAAGQRLLARCPEAQIWEVRVGSPTVRQFGLRDTRAST